jgi:hypothetical protein
VTGELHVARMVARDGLCRLAQCAGYSLRDPQYRLRVCLVRRLATTMLAVALSRIWWCWAGCGTVSRALLLIPVSVRPACFCIGPSLGHLSPPSSRRPLPSVHGSRSPRAFDRLGVTLKRFAPTCGEPLCFHCFAVGWPQTQIGNSSYSFVVTRF